MMMMIIIMTIITVVVVMMMIMMIILTFRGESPSEADLNLLDTARKMELYGIRMNTAKVHLKNKTI